MYLEGLIVALIGISVVISFLVIMILFMNLLAPFMKLVGKFMPEVEVVVQNTAKNVKKSDDEVAVAIAAVNALR